METQLLTLKNVQKHFDHWRKTRANRGPLPEHLWEEAVSLTNHHCVTHITRALRLNVESFKARVKAIVSNNNTSISKPITFVQLQLQEQICTGETSNYGIPSIEFKRPDGITMRIQIPHSFLPTLLETFIKGGSCYN